MAWQHRHQAEDQRQLAVIGAGQIEPHRERIGRVGLCDFGIILPVVGAALVAQQGPGKQHVIGGDRLAVGEARTGIETEGDVSSGVIGVDGFREQAVERKGFIIATCHQALDDKPSHLLDSNAAHDLGIEAVKGSQHPPDQAAALGRGWIGIGHVGEVGWQRRCTVHGDGVGFRRPGPLAACSGRNAKSEQGADESAGADAS